MIIDWHTHSHYSDGSDTLEMLFGKQNRQELPT